MIDLLKSSLYSNMYIDFCRYKRQVILFLIPGEFFKMGRLFDNRSKSGKDSRFSLGGKRLITQSSMAWLDWDDRSQAYPFETEKKKSALLPPSTGQSESDTITMGDDSETASPYSYTAFEAHQENPGEFDRNDRQNQKENKPVSHNKSKKSKKTKNRSTEERKGGLFTRLSEVTGLRRVVLNLAAGGLLPLLFFGFLFLSPHLNSLRNPVEISLNQDTLIGTLLQDYAAPEYNGIGDGGPEVPAFLNWDFDSMKVHVVTANETPSEIAQTYKVSLSTLLSFNDIQDVQGLAIGQELKIPPFDAILYKVRRGDMLGSIAYRHDVSVNYLVDANQLEDHLIYPGQVLVIPEAQLSDFDLALRKREAFVWPTRGRLSSLFGGRPDPFTGRWRNHNGLDIANATGTLIAAAMSGRVVQVGNSPMGYGKYVLVDHGNGFQTLYAHMNTINVRKGERVNRNQKLGLMGNTGRSTGSHLHFTIYLRGVPVNPQNYLK